VLSHRTQYSEQNLYTAYRQAAPQQTAVTTQSTVWARPLIPLFWKFQLLIPTCGTDILCYTWFYSLLSDESRTSQSTSRSLTWITHSYEFYVHKIVHRNKVLFSSSLILHAGCRHTCITCASSSLILHASCRHTCITCASSSLILHASCRHTCITCASSSLILHASCRHTCITCVSSSLILHASCRHTCITCAIAECTVANSWWWAEELPETCRVFYKNKFGNECVCWFH